MTMVCNGERRQITPTMTERTPTTTDTTSSSPRTTSQESSTAARPRIPYRAVERDTAIGTYTLEADTRTA